MAFEISSKKVYILAFAILFSLNSCMTTKTNVGEFREIQGSEYTYAKAKQFWLFWGLIPIGRTNVNTPGHGNCQVITRFNIFDLLINSLTGGLIISKTIKIKVKR